MKKSQICLQLLDVWEKLLTAPTNKGPNKRKVGPTSLPVPSLPNLTHRLLKGVRIASHRTFKT